jgi:hypothetical protein
VICMHTRGKVWTEENVHDEILKCMEILDIKRIPTSGELLSINRNDLHMKISKTKKYSGWAKHLGLKQKESCTKEGQDQEENIYIFLSSKGYSVERMSTGYPYDLLVNGTVKIDVKSANPLQSRGSVIHTFGISKTKPTCDVYVCLALNEEGNAERCLVIPSHFLKIVTLCIGKNSKYNRFIDKWNYIEEYTKFYSQII